MPSRFAKRNHAINNLAKDGLQGAKEALLHVWAVVSIAARRGIETLTLSIPVAYYKTMVLVVASAGLLLLLFDGILIRVRASKLTRLFDSEMELVRKRV